MWVCMGACMFDWVGVWVDGYMCACVWVWKCMDICVNVWVYECVGVNGCKADTCVGAVVWAWRIGI